MATLKERRNKTKIHLKHNLKHGNHTVLLIITNSEKWHLAVKSLSRLLRGITSNHNNDHYCMNCLHSFRKKHENHMKMYVKIIILIQFPWKKDNDTLNHNTEENCMKVSFVTYADTESLLEKIDT